MAPMLAKPFRGVKRADPQSSKFELVVSLKESPTGSGSKLLTRHRRMIVTRAENMRLRTLPRIGRNPRLTNSFMIDVDFLPRHGLASAPGGQPREAREAGCRPLVAREGDMGDQEIRAALDRHWAASDANDFETEHSIYREDAVLEYPQSGERIRGRRNIQITRTKQPSKKRFTVRRISGSGNLWVSEYILTYDGKPSYTVSIMEFSGDKVARETQYFADPFEASAWRAQWVERMDA
jgi:hypothetical protein